MDRDQYLAERKRIRYQASLARLRARSPHYQDRQLARLNILAWVFIVIFCGSLVSYYI